MIEHGIKRHLAAVVAAMLAAAILASPAFAQQQQQQQRPTQRAPQQPQQRPAAAPAPAAPAEMPPNGTPFVVVDILLVLRDSTAAQGIRGQFEKQRTAFQAEIAKQEKDLRAADEELARQRAILSPEAFAQKRRELERKVGEAQQAAQGKRRKLDQAFNEAMQQVERKVFEVVAEIASERDYKLALHKAQVVVVQTSLEITPEVLRRVNQKLPTVAVKLPQN
ncbi:MAG TPA: OmpH family outer membrane protein [Alphaproteobacteria bacterium]|jgi:Skp family chaperone for outer membrane proteins|nr:OmpH family outer membrane protein [Alphaproteobacteria bacterium]